MRYLLMLEIKWIKKDMNSIRMLYTTKYRIAYILEMTKFSIRIY
jgi:hypothetical protein